MDTNYFEDVNQVYKSKSFQLKSGTFAFPKGRSSFYSLGRFSMLEGINILGLKEGDAAVAGPKAALASRTNTLFSVGMLYFMVASAHYPASGQILGANLEMTGLLVGLAIIFAIQANAIWGKMLPAITSVRSVIVSSFVLCIALSSVAYYL